VEDRESLLIARQGAKILDIILMNNIHLNKPYSIITDKLKRYQDHYQISAAEMLVVPKRSMGEESSCDVRWEDVDGALHVMHNVMFRNENLVALDFLLYDNLYKLWKHYY
jgi:hypothetical protein